jgi:hypothetical protein
MLAELGQAGITHKRTSGSIAIVRSLAIELPAIVGHECDADEITVDEISELPIDVQAHGALEA